MTQSTNNDIKYITDLLVELKSDIKETHKRFDKVDERLEKIKDDVSTIKTDLAIVQTKLEAQQKTLEAQQMSLNKIPELAEKVGELKNWRQIAIIIITGTASTVFGWFLKSGRGF